MTTNYLPGLAPRRKRPPRVKGRKLKAGERSLSLLRKRGYTADVAEKFVARVDGKGQAARFAGGYRKDLHGFIDILAYSTHETLAVQTTSRQQITAHLRAYRRDPELVQKILDWILNPTRRLVIHGWECVEARTKRGGIKAVWECTERVVTVADVQPETVADLRRVDELSPGDEPY